MLKSGNVYFVMLIILTQINCDEILQKRKYLALTPSNAISCLFAGSVLDLVTTYNKSSLVAGIKFLATHSARSILFTIRINVRPERCVAPQHGSWSKGRWVYDAIDPNHTAECLGK